MKSELRREIPALTGLRACAAMGVFLTHVYVAFEATGLAHAVSLIGNAGSTGVTLFFVLSGYLLSAPSTMARGARDYALRRFARIYPIYAFTLVLMLVLIEGARRLGSDSTWSVGTESILANLFLLQSWHPDGMSFSIVYPAWSLSVECLFYLLLPLTLPRFARVTRRRPIRTFICLVVLLAVSCMLVATGTTTPVFPPALLCIFYVGALLSIQRPQISRSTLSASATLALALLVVGVGLGLGPILPFILALPYAIIVHGLATLNLRTPLSSPWMVYLGRCSYSFFLIHSIVISISSALVFPDSPAVSTAVQFAMACLLGSWIAAIAMYRLIEIPAQKRILRLLRRHQSLLPQVHLVAAEPRHQDTFEEAGLRHE